MNETNLSFTDPFKGVTGRSNKDLEARIDGYKSVDLVEVEKTKIRQFITEF